VSPRPGSAYYEANLARTRQRLARVALVFGLAFLFLSTVVGLAGLQWLEPEVIHRHNQHVDVISAGLWILLAVVAQTPVSHLTVLRLGQVVVVLSSFSLAFVSGVNNAISGGEIPLQVVAWSTVWIVAYPLLIQSNVRATVAVVSLAALCVPGGVALGMLAGGGAVDGPAVVASVVAPAIGAVLATIGSDLVYRNTVDIQQLKEREILLSTMLDGIDDVVLLRDKDGREVFATTRRAPDAVLAAQGLVVQQAERAETWAVSHRDVALDRAHHVLTVARRLTAHLEEAEVESWKRLIRALSHELNNSLAPMSSLLHSMRLVLENPEQMGHLEGLISSLDRRVEHLTAFLSEYSAFARLPRPRLAEVDWKDFVEGLRPLVPFEVEGELDGSGRFDRGQIEQVVLNLLKNAEESGSATAEIALSVEADDVDWLITVSDRGSGLSDEVGERATLPFFSTKAEGTGLGLALCRDIALAHGGRFSISRRDGGGAIARVWLPRGSSGSA